MYKYKIQIKHAQKCKKIFDLLSIIILLDKYSKEALLVSVLAVVLAVVESIVMVHYRTSNLKVL